MKRTCTYQTDIICVAKKINRIGFPISDALKYYKRNITG